MTYNTEIGNQNFKSELEFTLNNLLHLSLASIKGGSYICSSKLATQDGLAAILLMMAHDEFSTNELCLPCLFASSNVHGVGSIMGSSRNVHGLALSWAVARLDGLEVVRLVKYLGKWVRKYEKFSKAGSCPEAEGWGLKYCKCVPSIEAIVGCLGSVLDEHLLYLTLCDELHEELRSIEEVVRLLAIEAGFCCSLASVIESFKTQLI